MANLLIGAEIEQTGRLVLRASSKPESTRMILQSIRESVQMSDPRFSIPVQGILCVRRPSNTYAYTVHVRLVAEERLLRCVFPHVPQLAGAVHRPGHVRVLVRAHRDRHHVTGVCIKLGRFLADLQIPDAARTSETRRVMKWCRDTYISQRDTYIFISPDPVRMCVSSRNRQELRKPS